ncbi:MAG: DUF21 domain-containing protein [Elusimicrobia bacterium]|nr:DUF21 domain-containing protein [Elusimicrobiota bacterium]
MDGMGVTLDLAISVLLLGLNAFFVLAEFSIVKVRASRLSELSKKGNATAALAHAITQDLDAYLSTIQLGITMASLGLGWLGEPALAKTIAPILERLPSVWGGLLSHSLAFGIAFVFITGTHVVIGELAPKSLAIRSPERYSMWCARPLSFFHTVFFVPMSALNWLSNRLLRLSGLMHTPSEYGYSMDEMKALLSQAQEQGQISLRKLLLFENLFDFGAATLKTVTTPTEKVAFLSRKLGLERNLRTLSETNHSRYPLCESGMGTAFGYLHIRDFQRALLDPACGTPDPFSFKRDVMRLVETTPMEEALARMQRGRSHLALVTGPAGAVLGIVTLEDVLEELVGEIRDEFDKPGSGDLDSLLVPEASDLSMTERDKEAALKALLGRLHRAAGSFDLQEAWQALWAREQGLSSAMGRSTAFPHARLAGLARPLIAVGGFPKGLRFDALDRQPVRLVFLILTPLGEPAAQLRILAKLAALISDEALRSRLLAAADVAGLRTIIKAFDQHAAG